MDAIPFSRRPLAHIGILLIMMLTVLAIELAMEWRAHGRGHDTLLLGSATNQNADTSNRYPFRSPPVSIEKPNGITRLWIAGASHAEDSYQPIEQIFPTLTCTALNQQGHRCEVINGSNAGTGIEGNLALLAQYAPQYRPDIVLLYQGSIEIQDLSKLSFIPASNGPAMEMPGDWHRGVLDPIRETIEATTLFAHLTQGVRTRLMAAKQLHDQLPDSAIATFRARVEQFVARTRALGATPVLTTFAARYTAGQHAQFDDELFRSQLRYNPYLSRAGWLDSIERLNHTLRDIGQQQQLPVIDLAAAVAGEADAFRDFSHFSAAGHQRVATAIATGLQPLLTTSANQTAAIKTATVVSAGSAP